MHLSQYSRSTTVAPAQIFDAWADPVSWPAWDTSVANVEFEGPMRVGVTGRLTPIAGPPSTFTITDVVPGRLLTNSSRLPGARLDFIHRLEPDGDAHVATVEVRVVGPLAGVWGRLLRKSLAESAPTSVNGLVDMLEGIRS